jgi:hypothetical protein
LEEKAPDSEQVRHLLDRFLAAAPETARSLVAETGRAVIDGLQSPRACREWLTSPAGVVAVGGGLSLFGAGWVLGRRVRVSRRTGLCLAAAVAAGFAAGLAVRAGRAPTAQASAGRSMASRQEAPAG